MNKIMKQKIKLPPVKRKLNVLMVAPQPWFQPRGTPFSVLHRIKAMSLLGHSIDLVTYHIGEDIKIDNLTIYRAAQVPFVKNVKIGPSKTKIILDLFLYMKTRRLLKNKFYDLLHTHEEASFWGVPLAKKYAMPHLYDMHSSLPQQLNNFKFTKSGLIRNIFHRLENYVIENSNAVITICPELQSYVEQNFPAKTSILIENVADNNIVFPQNGFDEHAIRSRFNLDGKRIILYYGTLETYQGIDLLIKSARKVVQEQNGNVHFVLVGGSKQQILHYKKMTADQGVEANFTFTGFLQPQMIPNMVAVSDILVSPRLRGTNSPLKIYSYLRSGKPIVATRHITHTQIMDDSVAVLTEPTADDFAQGILSVIDDPQRRNSIVAAAQNLAEEKYSYNDYLQKVEQILEKAVEVKY